MNPIIDNNGPTYLTAYGSVNIPIATKDQKVLNIDKKIECLVTYF